MDIAAALAAVKSSFANDGVKLVAVSKTFPVERIAEAYAAGQRVFGENRVQELVPKQEALPKDIEWHLIGTLQSNKIKYIVPFVSLIHSIDSLKLLQAVNKEALKNNRIVDCLLQIYIAKEESKFGLDFEEARTLLNSTSYSDLKNIRITGLMGMATNTKDLNCIRSEFKSLFQFYKELKEGIFKERPYFKERSMGMSADYKIAIDEGSTMVRIGSAIFRAAPPSIDSL
jgi:pyridoxal phosphate enzyme (YggS family)